MMISAFIGVFTGKFSNRPDKISCFSKNTFKLCHFDHKYRRRAWFRLKISILLLWNLGNLVFLPNYIIGIIF